MRESLKPPFDDTNPRVHRIENHILLIRELAYKSWHMLSPQLKARMDAEDLAHECVAHARSVQVKYDANRAGRFSTFLYWATRNYLMRRKVWHMRKIRWAPEDDLSRLDDKPSEADQYFRYEAERAFLTVLSKASGQLSSLLRSWLVQRDIKPLKSGSDLIKEFQRLSREHGLTIDHCRLIMKDAAISSELIYKTCTRSGIRRLRRSR